MGFGDASPDFQRASAAQRGFPERDSGLEFSPVPHRVHQRAQGEHYEAADHNPLTSFPNLLAGEIMSSFQSIGQAIRRRYKFHDRGTGHYEELRRAGNRPYLVMTGRHAGRLHLHFMAFDWRKWRWHLWTKDFFTSIAAVNLGWICVVMLGAYTASYIFWAFVWAIVWAIDHSCLAGFTTFHSPSTFYIFSAVTQATIGYGNFAANPCWTTAVVLTLQNVYGMLLDAVSLGIIVAKINHPKKRGRSILISECAVISRRNGLLKFMFRIADIRSNTACDAKVRAFLYTWGDGRNTMEGEHIPVRVESLQLGNVHGMLLLPLTVEHTIDERSPLYGLNHDHLEAANCEVVVTFEAVSEFGDTFMVRQSYLADEIHWGHMFSCIIHKADPGSTYHMADLSRFHDVEPQPNMPALPPSELSKAIISTGTASRMLPYPLLGENTLVISQCCTLTKRNGTPTLSFRVGDTRPCQMLEVHVRMYMYTWTETRTPEGEVAPYTVQEVDLGFEQGRDRLILRFPQTVRHEITEASPLAPWVHESAAPGGPHTELVVLVEGVMFLNADSMMRSITYRLPQDVRYGEHFKPMVARAGISPASGPAVDWSAFHVTTAAGAGVVGQSSAASAAAAAIPPIPPRAMAPVRTSGANGMGARELELAALPSEAGAPAGYPAAGDELGVEKRQSSSLISIDTK